MAALGTNGIVLVGDIVEDGTSRPTPFDWDNPTRSEVEQLMGWLSAAGHTLEVVPSVSAFASAASAFTDRIIFPLWRGGMSRNRTSIVPAICEAHGLPYIGADAFSQGVCQDKSLSKQVLMSAGIEVPPDLLIHGLPLSPASRKALEMLPWPVVVKPLTSACSIGVEEKSLCTDANAAISRVDELIGQGLGPVLCEPFVVGDEISLCLIESGGTIDLRCIAAHRTKTGECPFYDRLFTHQEKISGQRNWHIDRYPGAVAEEIWTKIGHLIARLGPFDLLRLDGKIKDGRFTAIEITPDIHLGLDSAFLGGFDASGIPPSTVLDAVVAASSRNWAIGGTRPAGRAIGVSNMIPPPTSRPGS